MLIGSIVPGSEIKTEENRGGLEFFHECISVIQESLYIFHAKAVGYFEFWGKMGTFLSKNDQNQLLVFCLAPSSSVPAVLLHYPRRIHR